MAIAPLAMAVLLALIAGGLYADPLTNTSSPQSDVTLGKIESNADYFMSVRNYANMDFDKWWSVIAYKTQSYRIYTSSELAQIGFATRFGGLYTALSYRGNGLFELGKWSGGVSSVFSHTEEIIGGKTWKVFNDEPKLDWRSGGGPRLLNEAAVLLGFADMGVRLYYTSTYQSNNVADYAVGSGNNLTYRKSWREEYGHINPGITWGMTRALIPDRGIKPVVNIDLDFYRDKRMWEHFIADNDPASGIKGTNIDVANNSFTPGVNLSTGALTLATAGNFSLDIDLDYGIKWSLYENDYSYTNAAGKLQIKTLSGGRTHEGGNVFSDIFEISHSLTPAISAGWSGNRLRLACRLGVPMTLYKRNETEKVLKSGSNDGSLIKTGKDDIETIYTLRPALDLAMQWEIVPSRLFLNVGGKLAVFQAIYTIMDRNEYENDEVKANSKYRQIDNRFYSAATNLYLGLTFNLTPNIELQAALGVDSNNNINVFSSSFDNRTGTGVGGFINFGNILVALKY